MFKTAHPKDCYAYLADGKKPLGAVLAEKQVKIASALYDARMAAKLILGDKYKEHMKELGGILTATSEKTGVSVLQVATDVCKKRMLTGMDALFILAAAVEIAEPSV
jgi:hypothetical protein